MKIYYFTGTGNTLSVARALKTENDQVIPILPFIHDYSTEDEKEVLFVFPVYMNALPKPYKRFFEMRDFSKCDYIAAVATHSGVPGKIGAYMNKFLNDKGLVLDAFFDLKTINNTPKGVAPKPLMKLNWETLITDEIVASMESDMESQLPLIKERLSRRTKDFQTRLDKESKFQPSIFDKFLWKIGNGKAPKLDFILDSSCSNCGICEKVCPSGRIEMSNNGPGWNDDVECYYCYACFNFCSEQAIGVKHYTKKLGRYHHPKVSKEDLVMQKNFPMSK